MGSGRPARAREEGAHARVLGEVVGGRVGRGADVQQHERPLSVDHLDGERRPIDAGQAPEAEDAGGHAGARVARGHDRVGLGRPDERMATRIEASFFAGRTGGVLVHADELGSRARRGRWPVAWRGDQRA